MVLIWLISQQDDRLEIEVDTGTHLNGLFEQFALQGVEVVSMRNKANRLEEFFIRRIGEDSVEA